MIMKTYKFTFLFIALLCAIGISAQQKSGNISVLKSAVSQADAQEKTPTPSLVFSFQPYYDDDGKGYYGVGNNGTGEIYIKNRLEDVVNYYSLDKGETWIQADVVPTVPLNGDGVHLMVKSVAKDMAESDVLDHEFLIRSDLVSVCFSQLDDEFFLPHPEKEDMLKLNKNAELKLYFNGLYQAGSSYAFMSFEDLNGVNKDKSVNGFADLSITIGKCYELFDLRACNDYGYSAIMDRTSYKPYKQSYKYDMEDPVRGIHLVYRYNTSGLETAVGLDEAIESLAKREQGSYQIKLNTVISGCKYIMGTLFAHTRYSDREFSSTYCEPGDFIKFQNGEPMAVGDYVQANDPKNFTQYDWIMIQGVEVDYTGKVLYDLVVTYDYNNASPRIFLETKNYPTEDQMLDDNRPTYVPNTYRPVNFFDREARKGSQKFTGTDGKEYYYEADMFFVKPRNSEYAKVYGMLGESKTTITDANGNAIQLAALVDISGLESGKWYAFTGFVAYTYDYGTNSEVPGFVVTEDVSNVPTNVESVQLSEVGAYGSHGAITIESNAERAEIYTLSGALVMSIPVNGKVIVPMTSGAYIVKTDSKAYKVLVK